MRIKLNKPIPHCFRAHPEGGHFIVYECDITISPRGRLTAKFLIFRHRHDLQQFWKRVLGRGDLGKQAVGAVNSLSTTNILVKRGHPDQHWLSADPNYFCVIGMVMGYINMESICHEAAHAGFAYAKRVHRNIFCAAGDLDEEGVCYPTGRIAKAINRFCHDKGLYQGEKKQ